MNDITIPIQTNLVNTPMDLGEYLSKFIGVALIIAAIVSFGYLVLSGIYWITAGGDEKNIEKAKNRITGAIIGLAIVAASWALFLIIDNFFGLNMAGKTSSYDTTAKSGNSYTSPGGSTTTNGSTVSGIGFNCISTTTCDKYCPNQEYYTVRYPGMENCGSGKIGCACVNKSNPKVNPCPSGLSCQ